MSLTIWLCKGKKGLREKFHISLNDVLSFYRKSRSNLQHKCNSDSLQVQTAHFVIVVNEKQLGTSFGKKTAQKLGHINNNPLDVIITLLTLYP